MPTERQHDAVDLSGAKWLSGPGPDSGTRVEVAFVGDLVYMRDGLKPEGVVLEFTQDEWEAFVAGAKEGEFDA